MTVWSLTPFFNELDVLEIKLAEQAPVVDVFVIAESTTTYRGDQKPLYLTDDLSSARWDPWRDKMRVVVVDDPPDGEAWQPFGDRDRWARENHQRRALGRGVDGIEPTDVVMLSDLDEILRCEVIEWYRDQGLKIMVQPDLPIGVMWLNARWSFSLPVIARLAPGSMLIRHDPEELRRYVGMRLPIPLHGDDPLTHYGWHFSYVGGPDAIRTKVAQAAHPELERAEWLTDEWLEACMKGERELFNRYRPIHRFDVEWLPRHVRANMDRFGWLCCDELWQPLGRRPSEGVVSSARRRTARRSRTA